MFKRALAALATLFIGQAAQAGEMKPTPTCDRACLYGVLDSYLAALKAHDPGKAHWAALPKNSENNVKLRVGDGLWGTITALGDYDLRFADVEGGQVGFFGVVEESTTKAPIGLRLKVINKSIAEVETIVVRPQDSGLPWVNADLKTKPVLNEILPAKSRRSREEMIAIANGYFDTIQLNDGTLRTKFSPNCNRVENGQQSTNNNDQKLRDVWKLGCQKQFELGIYRYDDRLRDRRFEVIDEERGLVLAGAFIDHEGRLGDYTYSDGTKITSHYRRPHTFAVFELFKIKDGAIEQVEAVFFTVPYNMPSVWTH